MIQREDFIDRFSKKDYTKRDARVILDDFIETVEEILAEGESIQFRGFGSFIVKEAAPRECTSPTTGERIKVPAQKVVRFAPGQILKKAVKEGKIDG